MQVMIKKLLLLIDSEKAKLINIFWAHFFFIYLLWKIWILCIFSVYLFLRMQFKGKFCVYLILQNQLRLAKKNMHTKISTHKVDTPQIPIRSIIKHLENLKNNLTLRYREWLKKWKYLSFMEMKIFAFSVEGF